MRNWTGVPNNPLGECKPIRQPMISYAAEVPRRGNPSDAASISPSLSDRASSPVSQYFWNLVDEWSSAAYNREHSYESHQLRAPIPFIQPQFSPFHRPCEETECCHQMRERKPQGRSAQLATHHNHRREVMSRSPDPKRTKRLSVSWRWLGLKLLASSAMQHLYCARRTSPCSVLLRKQSCLVSETWSVGLFGHQRRLRSISLR